MYICVYLCSECMCALEPTSRCVQIYLHAIVCACVLMTAIHLKLGQLQRMLQPESCSAAARFQLRAATTKALFIFLPVNISVHLFVRRHAPSTHPTAHAQPVHLSRLSIYPSIYPCMCPSILLCVHVSAYASVPASIHLFVPPSVRVFVRVHIHVRPCVCPSVKDISMIQPI